MTREEAILQQHDPEFLKKRKRERLWLRAALGVGIMAVIVGSLAIAGYFKNEGRVTKIEKSACAQDPRNPTKECEGIREALARNESIAVSCIQHQRVEGTKGRRCPKWYIDRERGVSAGEESAATRTEPQPAASEEVAAGDVSRTSSPDDGDQGVTEEDHHSANEPTAGGTTPTATAPASLPTAADGGSQESNEVVPPSPAPAGGLLEQTAGAAAGVVDQAGKDVQQTVDNATCNPLVALCPKG